MIISTAQFTYNSKEKTFFSCISDLNDRLTREISLQSHKTGKILTFYLDKEIYNKEHELTKWVFKVIDSDDIDLKVIIFND